MDVPDGDIGFGKRLYQDMCGGYNNINIDAITTLDKDQIWRIFTALKEDVRNNSRDTAWRQKDW